MAYTRDEVRGDSPLGLRTPLQPTLSARIPLELFEETIDFMDRPALLGAALVCAAWYPRAMHNLFSTVWLRDRTQFMSLAKLAHAYPRVRSWLATTRKLGAVDLNLTDHELGWRLKTGPFLHAVPLVFGRMMSGLRSLHVEGGVHPHMLPKFCLALSQFKTIKSLSLRIATLNSVSRILWIISSFPQLTDLHLYRDIFFGIPPCWDDTRPSDFEPGCDIRLRRLQIDMDEDDVRLPGAVVDWLVRLGACTSLDDLTVCWGERPTRSTVLGYVNSILRAAGPSLTRYLEDADLVVYTDSEQHANLVHNTSLGSIDFGLVLVEDNKSTESWSGLLDNLTSILATVRSRQLEHISMLFQFQFIITNDALRLDSLRNVLENLDLMGLHDVMRRSYFERLKDVEMLIIANNPVLHPVSEAHIEDARQELLAMFRALLMPWCDRNVVNLSVRR
ncbi:uncharacterized protein B0H18DRAFT_68138 [Fomitopsis serialis]|uniref:uncharacterized protein n=1 Tax=Fomitopsis serialis TaxID=139415 RepID=UPI0020072CCA|nr:uncharacterized protein B0H18DRAFT_68138 [Neoantrodia serialis]KAH9931821.1 hypothetical protein B0H18DRAFT_68138 [Neoantrodia serialis]